MRINLHPLHGGQIQPAPAPYPVDDLTERIYRREGVRPGERALPTATTTNGHPAWKWGRAVDQPSNSGAPVIFSPSMLQKAPAEQAADGPADLRTKFGIRR
jgi:hypothetical protein